MFLVMFCKFDIIIPVFSKMKALQRKELLKVIDIEPTLLHVCFLIVIYEILNSVNYQFVP